MMNKLNDLRNNNRFVLIVGGCFALLMLLLLLISPFNGKSKTTGGDYSPNKDVAYFVDSTELYNALGSGRFTSLQKDLRAHFNTVVPKYNQPVNFSVKSVTKTGDTITIQGDYKQKGGAATFSVKLLNNDQMDVTAVSGKVTSHDALPSNSKINKYIASLPIYAGNYDITYLPVDKAIVVTMYDRDPELIDKIRATIQQVVGADMIDSVPVSYLFPPDPAAQQTEGGIADDGNRGDNL